MKSISIIKHFKKIIIVIIFILSFVGSSALAATPSSLEWSRTYTPDANWSLGFSIAVDPTGTSIVTTGQSYTNGITTIKYDTNGNVISGWPVFYSSGAGVNTDRGHDVILDGSGNVYVMGSS